MTAIAQIIRKHSSPLEPLPTDTEPLLATLPGIRAVLFDVYGTMFISASGEVGTADAGAHDKAFGEALQALDMPLQSKPAKASARLREQIEERHAYLLGEGVEYPEVDIIDVWDSVLSSLFKDRLITHASFDEDSLQELATQYEVRTNPVWPMPGLSDCLAALRDAGLLLGIVSNAQFFTPSLFPALLSKSAAGIGFHPKLQYFSYRFEQAKPGLFLYERACEGLASLGITPAETLYVGNDMLNDITPAAQLGFRTALFAGDARSLRLREGDERVAGVKPDVVVTQLDQLCEAAGAG